MARTRQAREDAAHMRVNVTNATKAVAEAKKAEADRANEVRILKLELEGGDKKEKLNAAKAKVQEAMQKMREAKEREKEAIRSAKQREREAAAKQAEIVAKEREQARLLKEKE